MSYPQENIKELERIVWLNYSYKDPILRNESNIKKVKEKISELIYYSLMELRSPTPDISTYFNARDMVLVVAPAGAGINTTESWKEPSYLEKFLRSERNWLKSDILPKEHVKRIKGEWNPSYLPKTPNKKHQKKLYEAIIKRKKFSFITGSDRKKMINTFQTEGELLLDMINKKQKRKEIVSQYIRVRTITKYLLAYSGIEDEQIKKCVVLFTEHYEPPAFKYIPNWTRMMIGRHLSDEN